MENNNVRIFPWVSENQYIIATFDYRYFEFFSFLAEICLEDKWAHFPLLSAEADSLLYLLLILKMSGYYYKCLPFKF